MTDAHEERERVRGRIADAVVAFVNLMEHYAGARFRMSDLVAFVTMRVGGAVAPESPGRILRLLAAENRVRYRVVNRRQSLYEARLVPQQGSLAL